MLTIITGVLSAVVAVAAFSFGIYQYRRSVHINIFRTYADKYNSIITPEKYEKWQAALSGKQEHWPELTPAMIQYLNLVWEECFLLEKKILPRYLWRHWLPEIRQIMSTEFARSTMEKYYFHYPRGFD